VTTPTTPTPTAEFIDAKQVEAYSTLRKHGRRIVFHLPTLRQFLTSTSTAN
jgi:hypothetical protein